MAARSAAASFREGMRIGQRDKEFDTLQGLRERQFDESTRRYEEGAKTSKDWRAEDIAAREVDKAENTRRYDEGVAFRKEQADVRASEHEQSYGLQKKSLGIQQAAASRAKETYDSKKAADAIKKQFMASQALAKMGDKLGAAKMAVNAYNSLWPGDEARVIHREMNPQDPIWKDNWTLGHEMLVTTKKDGVLPVKNVDDLMKLINAGTIEEDFLKDDKELEAQVVAKNEAAKPEQFRDETGNIVWQKKQYKRDNQNNIVSEDMPHKGPTPLAGGELQRQQAGVDEKSVTQGEIKGEFGLVDKTKPTAKEKKARIATHKATMDEFLRPFAKGGTMLLVDDSGDLSKAGTSAYAAALKLWNTYKRDSEAGKNTLSQDELDKVRYARVAVQTFDAWVGQQEAERKGKTGTTAKWKVHNY